MSHTTDCFVNGEERIAGALARAADLQGAIWDKALSVYLAAHPTADAEFFAVICGPRDEPDIDECQAMIEEGA